jgi:50S ribosomal protein L16 3-hydroxylase
MQLQGLLDAWLAPTDVTTFREEFFGRCALFRAGTPERLAPVLALSSWDVRELLARHTSSVVAWFQGLDGRHVTAYVSPEAAQRLYQGGITFYLRQVPALAPLTEAIATALTVPAQNIECTLFCNQPGARTRMHFDPIDTITMQVTGSKRWRLAPNLHASHPTVSYATLDPQLMPDLRLYAHDRLPTRMPDDAEEYILTPGSVLYVPRGFWHETESDEASISLHVHHIPVPWVDAVLVTLRAKLLRDPAWRAGAHDLWDASRRSHTAATADRLLDALAAAVDGLTADDVLATPVPGASGVLPDAPFVRCARAGFSTDAGADERPSCLVTFSVSAYGTERRTTLDMSPLYLDACRCFVAPGARGGLSARDLASLVPGLSVDEGLQLIRLLLDAGFVRPALAVDAWEGAYADAAYT